MNVPAREKKFRYLHNILGERRLRRTTPEPVLFVSHIRRQLPEIARCVDFIGDDLNLSATHHQSSKDIRCRNLQNAGIALRNTDSDLIAGLKRDQGESACAAQPPASIALCLPAAPEDEPRGAARWSEGWR